MRPPDDLGGYDFVPEGLDKSPFADECTVQDGRIAELEEALGNAANNMHEAYTMIRDDDYHDRAAIAKIMRLLTNGLLVAVLYAGRDRAEGALPLDR